MLASSLALLPPNRANGDHDMVKRIIRRPNNALEAFARAPEELVVGLVDALAGLVLDPMVVRSAPRAAQRGAPQADAWALIAGALNQLRPASPRGA